jgi:hypothetical protein
MFERRGGGTITMVSKRVTRTAVLLLFAILQLMNVRELAAQAPVYKPGEYPAPRYPKLKEHYTVDDLMPIARELVRRPYADSFLLAGYNIRDGQRVLIVVPRIFDRLVLDAISRAIHERGGQVDLVLTDVNEADLQPIMDGSAEANGIMEATPVDDNGSPILPVRGFSRNNIIALAENGFDLLVYGAGGPHNPIKFPGSIYSGIPSISL